ncbi:hypothetical protein SAMN04487970_100736 [Paenibacillus tianmuensis]|uniref:Uncharacterized protein n=1 Tax=Paenibacillus tianmuensis TaxID=624147 RepID=A0A1G4QIA5_9BACL|nr:hypothetical protein [Paenibacillus tianmuensis]SCW43819.1 hypothetical protein SAMN04487970_100736 [Paenibacillus tianmuensis]
MSSDKTKRLGLNKWVGSDQVLRAEFNENFDKIDAYVDDSLAVKTTSVQLKQGLQVVDVNQSSPLNNVTIQGRTLVNLLGRAGGFEAGDIVQWEKGSATLTIDTSTFVSGKSCGKVTTTASAVCYIAQRFTFKKGKYYILIAETKNGTATTGVLIGNNDFASTWNTDATKWTTQFVKINYTENREDYVIFNCSGAAGQTGYIDNYRVYEITRAEYDAIDSMTTEQIAAKWPYVDDMKSVYSPYIIKHGENGLPPMIAWNIHDGNTGANISFPDKDTLYIDKYAPGVSGIWYKVPIGAGQTYTFKTTVNIENIGGNVSDGGYYNLWPYDAQGKELAPLHSPPYAPQNGETLLQKTFAVPTNAVALGIFIGADIESTGNYTFSRPTLHSGSEALPFVSNSNDDYLFFPNVKLASNVDGTVHDTLFQHDGKYWKQARFKTMDLTGDLEWGPLGKGPGWKSVTTNSNTVAGAVLISSFGLGTFTKFDGKILGPYIISSGIDTGWIPVDYSVRIGIPNSDSGWSDKHDPSPDDIKAYFNGWRMFQEGQDPNTSLYTSGNKWWLNRRDNTTTTTPDISQSVWKVSQSPYKLQYQLATPTIEEITSEGGITLHEGLNQVEVGTGLIIRETIRWVDGEPLGYGVYYYTNHQIMAGGSTKFRKRAKGTVTVYKNGCRDFSTSSAGTSIDDWIKLDKIAFDPSAAYTVTYFALEQYALTCNIQSIRAEYAGNIKSVVDTLAAGQSDMAARVGALEITRAQRVQSQWIKPTLLNGWVNYGDGAYTDAGYFKDELGIIHIRGLVKNGQLNASIFMLPLGYRPARAMVIPVATDGNGQLILGRLTIDFNGSVYHTLGGTGWFSLDGISFLAER